MWYESLKFENPKTVEEALNCLATDGAKVIAGGTDELVQLREKKKSIKKLVNIGDIKSLKKIKKKNNTLIIGACVTYSEFLELASENLPPLTDAVKQIASPSIRNIATFGGNIVNASPAGDTLPVLYAFDAELLLESLKGKRVVKINDFITGPGETILNNGELLTEIRVKIPSFTYYYRKFGPRKALALSKVSFCGVHLNDSDEIRLAYGSVGPTVIRAYEAEELYKKGQKDKIPDLIGKLVQPINDQRSTAEYRRYLCVEMTREFLKKCENSF